ncbi:MAG: alpha/beta hydrolase, partial [Sandaracinaceae bacterium]
MIAVAVIVATVFGVVWLERKLLFPRGFTAEDPSARRTPGLEAIWIESDQGPVEAWFLPGDGVDASRPGPVVFFAHGNGELIDHWPRALHRYRELGVSVALLEYRGYGRSAGDPSEARIREDFEAFYARIVRDPRVDANRLVFHGRSLGGGAVCGLVTPHPPRALILESTFTSVADVARGMWIPGVLVTDDFACLPVVERYEGPLLVMHGTRDEVIPTAHGRRLAAAHPGADLVLYDSGHNDLPPPGSDYWD